MQILYENLIEDTDTLLTSSPTVNGYSIDNIRNYHLSKYVKFNGVTSTLEVDLVNPTLIDNIFLGNHNCTSILVEADTVNDWLAPPYSASLNVYNDWAGLQKINQTYRYWRLSFTSLNDVQVGYAYMGEEVQLPPLNPEIELVYSNTGTLTTSVTGQTYGDHGINYLSSAFTFPVITDYSRSINGKTIATREDLLVFWLTNQGVRPFILLLFEEALDAYQPMLAVITNNSMAFKMDRTQGWYSMKMSVQQTL